MLLVSGHILGKLHLTHTLVDHTTFPKSRSDIGLHALAWYRGPSHTAPPGVLDTCEGLCRVLPEMRDFNVSPQRWEWKSRGLVISCSLFVTEEFGSQPGWPGIHNL